MHSPCKRDQTGAAPVVGSISNSPVAQSVERPTLNREVDGANPSGAANLAVLAQLSRGTAFRTRKVPVQIRGTAPCASRSLADRRTDIAEKPGRNRPGAPFHQSSRSSMYRA